MHVLPCASNQSQFPPWQHRSTNQEPHSPKTIEPSLIRVSMRLHSPPTHFAQSSTIAEFSQSPLCQRQSADVTPAIPTQPRSPPSETPHVATRVLKVLCLSSTCPRARESFTPRHLLSQARQILALVGVQALHAGHFLSASSCTLYMSFTSVACTPNPIQWVRPGSADQAFLPNKFDPNPELAGFRSIWSIWVLNPNRSNIHSQAHPKRLARPNYQLGLAE